VTVEVAFTSNPTEATTWTDVSAYVRSVSIRRGRQHELDRIESGTCEIVLDNRDRRFDPDYADGPYYGQLIPMRRVRVRATYDDTTWPLFAGYVENWGSQWINPSDAIATLSAADGFKMLALVELDDTYVEELSSTRVENVLDDAGWTDGNSWLLGTGELDSTTILGPSGDREISLGQSTMQADTVADTSALAYLQTVELSENGLIFIDAAGSIVFHGRHRRSQPPYTDLQATFGDGGGDELPYADVEMAYDEGRVYNEALVTRDGGAEQSAEDTASQAKYFRRTLSRSGLLVTTDDEALSVAQYLVGRYAEPGRRIAGMTLLGHRNEDLLWRQILAREMVDRIRVIRRPVGGGDAIDRESFIEGIQHDIDRARTWVTRWALSPSDLDQFWVLDESALGTDTKLGY
jgi:hypothetical protein